MENFIFIMGCGHSGTTIFNKIISSHCNVFGISEETYLFQKSKRNILQKLRSFDNQRSSAQKKWVCEKTPRHVYCIDKIYQHVVNPKIIIMTRDGRDVVASLKARYGDINQSVKRWIDDNSEWLNHPKCKDFYVVKYENFIKNPTLEIKAVCDFIGEPFDENMLNYSQKTVDLPSNFYDGLINDKKHDLLRIHQINKDIYDGTNRYQKDLTEQELELLYSNDKFVNIMKILDYM